MPNEPHVESDFVARVAAKLANRRATTLAKPITPTYSALHEAAAVLSSFQIDTLRPAAGGVGDANVETLLANSISRPGTAEGAEWTLSPEARIATLRQLRESGRIDVALAANPENPNDSIQRTFRACLTGTLKSLEDLSLTEVAQIYQVVEWLSAAGFTNLPELSAIERRIEWLKLLEPFEHLAGEHFRGRKSELRRLRDYVEVQPPESTLQFTIRRIREILSLQEKPPLLIYGPGGVGKSTLLARFILDHARAHEQERFPFAYLDFDRAEISAAEPLTLLIESVRQLGIEYPDAHERCERIRRDWLDLFRSQPAAKPTPNLAASQTSKAALVSPAARSAAVRDFATLIDSIGADDRPVLLVLDTFEEVQYRSEDHVAAVWMLLEELQSAIKRLRVVIAGRGTIKVQKTELMLIEGLDPEAAVALLQALGLTDPNLASQIATAVGRSPLALRLAADLVVREGPAAFEDLRSSPREFLLFRLNDNQILRQLYTRILDHVHDERVRRLAHPGLVLRRLTPELILHVLAKPCGLKISSLEQAQELFDELGRELSLVTRDIDGALVHRPDLRRQMLPLLESAEPAKATAIHEAAVHYYEQCSTTPEERAEEIYHRLSLGQERDAIDRRWMEGVEPFLASAVEEFSGARQAYLASHLKIEVDETTLQLANLEDWEKIVERKVLDLLALGLPEPALDLLHSRLDRTSSSPLFALEAQALTLLERWAESLDVLDKGLQRAFISGEQQQVVALMLQAADTVIACRQPESAPWLHSRVEALAELNLQPEDRVEVTAHKIALSRLDLLVWKDQNDLEDDLREAFDAILDETLAKRPTLALWAASEFVGLDASRLLRVLLQAGLPRAGADRELRTLAANIASFDAAVSKNKGAAPGTITLALAVPIGKTLTASWADFLLNAPAERVQRAVCDLVEGYAPFLPVEVIRSFAGVMRAGLGVYKSSPAVSPSQATHELTPVVHLTGSELQDLAEALLSAFGSIQQLKSFLMFRLDLNLDALTATSSLQQTIYELVTWANRRGLIAKLVTSAVDSNPGNSQLAEVAAKFGLGTLASESSTIAAAPLLDIVRWREQLGLIEAQVCRVEIDGQGSATGFLVGPDLVMTADFVLEGVYKGLIHPSRVAIRFDYKTAGKDVISKGTVFELEDDWLVARSEYDEVEIGLGYVLLRVRNSPGYQTIGASRAESSAALRRWIEIAHSMESPRQGDGLIMISHPQAGPLVLTLDQRAITRVSEDCTRIYHTLHTEPGSSGAPCFTLDFQLLAFHIGKAKDDGNLRNSMNIAILMSAVIQNLDREGKRGTLDSVIA